MSTSSARYVHLRDRDLAKLQAMLPSGAAVHAEPSSTFAVVTMPEAPLEPEDLSAWSRELGEVIAVQSQSVADLVVYDHWRDGARTRGLTYAGEAGWIRVVGEPEPWEAAALFTAAKLEELIEELEADLTDPAILEREKSELRRLWDGGRLEEGNTRPPPDLAVMMRAIQKQYGLPSAPKRR